jgi:hypothetical protein
MNLLIARLFIGLAVIEGSMATFGAMIGRVDVWLINAILMVVSAIGAGFNYRLADRRRIVDDGQ